MMSRTVLCVLALGMGATGAFLTPKAIRLPTKAPVRTTSKEDVKMVMYTTSRPGSYGGNMPVHSDPYYDGYSNYGYNSNQVYGPWSGGYGMGTGMGYDRDAYGGYASTYRRRGGRGMGYDNDYYGSGYGYGQYGGGYSGGYGYNRRRGGRGYGYGGMDSYYGGAGNYGYNSGYNSGYGYNGAGGYGGNYGYGNYNNYPGAFSRTHRTTRLEDRADYRRMGGMGYNNRYNGMYDRYGNDRYNGYGYNSGRLGYNSYGGYGVGNGYALGDDIGYGPRLPPQRFGPYKGMMVRGGAMVKNQPPGRAENMNVPPAHADLSRMLDMTKDCLQKAATGTVTVVTPGAKPVDDVKWPFAPVQFHSDKHAFELYTQIKSAVSDIQMKMMENDFERNRMMTIMESVPLEIKNNGPLSLRYIIMASEGFAQTSKWPSILTVPEGQQEGW